MIKVCVLDDNVNVQIEGEVVSGGGGEAYTGSYEATPSLEEQVFSTGGKILAHNFVVNPIPSNYGLVTYSGSIITIS